MGGRPVVGIVCCTRDTGAETAQSAMTRYVMAAMRHAEADALLIPALPDLADAANLVARLDGLLLTGSPSNVAPGRYGAAGGAGPFDPARDGMMLALVAAAAEAGKTVFGICRGLQELNVALGGTLRGDVGEAEPHPHHAPGTASFAAMFDHEHGVTLTPGGLLARAHGADRLTINSVHHQGIARLAEPLAIEARADDGLVEAVSGESGGAPLLAVQWHPEWDADRRPDRQTFFHLLGRALRGARLPELVA